MLHRIWLARREVRRAGATTGARVGENLVTAENSLRAARRPHSAHRPSGRRGRGPQMPRKVSSSSAIPDRYDVAARSTSVQDDHVGVDGIDTIEQMAELKARKSSRARNRLP